MYTVWTLNALGRWKMRASGLSRPDANGLVAIFDALGSISMIKETQTEGDEDVQRNVVGGTR
jgi:hypothetical protein